MFLIYLILFGLLIDYNLALKCLNEQEQEVDWWIFYKLPKLDSDSWFQNGHSYVYVTSRNVNDHDWSISNYQINSSDSIIGTTLDQIYSKYLKINYVQYNDEIFLYKDLSDDKHGHAKGILAYDTNDGFWIIHSVPNFPTLFNTSYDFPKSGIEKAQIGLCVSFSTELNIEKITEQLRIIQPNIYGHNRYEKTKDYLYKLIEKDWNKKDENVASIHSLNGIQFLSLVKSPKFKVDIYSDTLAPYLKNNFTVESWRIGKGGSLDSNCTSKTSIHNIEKIRLISNNYPTSNTTQIKVKKNKNFFSNIWSRLIGNNKAKIDKLELKWSYTKDHSKWAIAETKDNPYVCIGDLNRIKSQKKRGGGVLCQKNAALWTIFYKILDSIEQCH